MASKTRTSRNTTIHPPTAEGSTPRLQVSASHLQGWASSHKQGWASHLGLSFTLAGLGFTLAALCSTLAGLGCALAQLGFSHAEFSFSLVRLGPTFSRRNRHTAHQIKPSHSQFVDSKQYDQEHRKAKRRQEKSGHWGEYRRLSDAQAIPDQRKQETSKCQTLAQVVGGFLSL